MSRNYHKSPSGRGRSHLDRMRPHRSKLGPGGDRFGNVSFAFPHVEQGEELKELAEQEAAQRRRLYMIEDWVKARQKED